MMVNVDDIDMKRQEVEVFRFQDMFTTRGQANQERSKKISEAK